MDVLTRNRTFSVEIQIPESCGTLGSVHGHDIRAVDSWGPMFTVSPAWDIS